ncbi:Phage minor structural protein GP20 [Peptoniphilus asaccharolyticus DSM 20463]|uniref:Phage minor structural protein GP20 n=1 Tax=Peptoniphilus asaccharolyticus DSM 20463 TaxID=573058 RepID=A0A1W1V002_PEPAS|nr:phage scaffolding protein [Peptoniphilus asaccharolyticus]MBL7575375.1 phage scaffolding protein [Peptoniphilus asaccharolyticus]SMB86341.1 Phage minor structural protein GP20 [Peptoniphilus asaccharolyticus DSM 20463]
MKKEELLELGLTEEQIQGVFKLNGQDINSIKSERDNLKSELEVANNKISELGDYENVKAEVEKYKNEISDLKLNHSIENSLMKSKVKNPKAAKALLDIEALKNSKNFDSDLENQIKSMKESDSYLFEVEGSSVGGAGSVNEPNVKDMTYSQMVEYLEKNPSAKI